MQTQIPAPFSCIYSPNLAELLGQMRCSIAVSTFQAGKVLFLSPKNDEEMVLLPRTFHKAMGLALQGDQMAVATKSEVVLLKNVPALAHTYPKKPNTYDALYVPRTTYYTGAVDIHDLHFGKQELWAVNTSFSCLCTIEPGFSFTPQWQPTFITELVSEDRCHLNGLAMENDKPRFVSALGKSNTKQGWRDNITQGGILLDVESKEIVAHSLAMPHTPRIWNDKLYVLLSAKEQLVSVDLNTGQTEVVAHIGGFVRGMAKYMDHVFIATSKLRKNSSTFRHLTIAEKANTAGITIIHLPTGSKVAQLTFQSSVDEMYDIQILPNIIRPNILNT
ncbi:MAG: TIGR03032 family protein, partial [Saprospiraceae bacterium]|nr:TIGR03032 family protein [Saprospiraceae bacterium]